MEAQKSCSSIARTPDTRGWSPSDRRPLVPEVHSREERMTGSSDESFDRLHRAGRTVGEVCCGDVWLVSGYNGENLIRAEGDSQEAAWRVACDQAAAVG